MKAFTSALLPVVFLCVVASAHSAATFTPDSNPAVTSIAALPFASMTSESIASTGILREKHSTRADAPSRTEDPRRTAGLMQQSGIRFIENRGQIAGTDGRVRTDVAFVADAPGARLFCRSDGISYIFSDLHRRTSTASRDAETAMSADAASVRDAGSCRLDMILDGSNPRVRIRAEEPLPGYANYYLPHCPDGITGVREYGRIVYENVYDNVDLELFSVNGRMKYNFVVRPGGRVADIRMRYEGAESLALTGGGALSVAAPLGRIEEAVPYTWAGTESNEIASRFLRKGNTVSFAVASYDPHETLVIDPWATYYGGSVEEWLYGITTDASGNVYVTGFTRSLDFPVSGGYQMTSGGAADVFIVKFDGSGSRVWATYFGGSGEDWAEDIKVDDAGNPVIAGTTWSSDFPAAGGYQTTPGGNGDAFVAKFDGSGNRIWASYYGGSEGDKAAGLAIDGGNNIVFTGRTASSNFPVTPGAFQTSKAKAEDAFVVRMNAGGNRLWATYYGGRGADYATGIAVDLFGDICFTGTTGSTNFPVTSGAYQLQYGGGGDVFLVKIAANGTRTWGTYIGGSNMDYGNGVCIDGSGCVVVAFHTHSTDLTTTVGAFQPSHAQSSTSNSDAFIMKFSSAGARLWATYYGGSYFDKAESIAVDGYENVIFGGYTSGSDFPITAGAFQTVNLGNVDATLVKLDGNGNRLWATYFGGSGQDEGYAVSVDAAGNVFFGGMTASTDLPTFNPYQSALAGPPDAFIVQLNASGLIPGFNHLPIAVASATPAQGIAPLNVAFSSAGSYDPDGTIVAYSWDFGDGGSSTALNPSHTYLAAGSYTATLTVTDNSSATTTAVIPITVSSGSAYVYVHDQTVTRYVGVKNRTVGRDLVTVYDENDMPVSGAVVTASYTGPNSGTVSGTTGANGTVTLQTAVKTNPSGLWCFTVTNVQLSGYSFNTSKSELYACETAPKHGIFVAASALILEQNYPNPFNPSTTIIYGVPERCHVRLTVLDMYGRKVCELVDGAVEAGMHVSTFDGSGLPSGTYISRLEVNGSILTRTMTLLK